MSKFAPDKCSQTAFAVNLSLLLEEVGSVLHQPHFISVWRISPLLSNVWLYISHPMAEAPSTAAEAPSSPLMRNWALPRKTGIT